MTMMGKTIQPVALYLFPLQRFLFCNELRLADRPAQFGPTGCASEVVNALQGPY